MAYSLSPLRYPGGKSVLTPFLRSVLETNGMHGGTYAEPFCGGAGIGLGLLLNGIVRNIILNDVDPSIYAFWWALLNKSESFIHCIEQIPINTDEWQRQKGIFFDPSAELFDRGFATFFLNRCNHSGILSANPIGGIRQNGKWKIDARFNKKSLISRIENIIKYKDKIIINNLDVFDFIKNIQHQDKNIFIYFDPPYLQGGPTLYLNSFTEKTHLDLASSLRGLSHKWIMTYDDARLLHKAYEYCRIMKFELSYSVHKKRKGIELLIIPEQTILPDSSKLKCV